jgi:hypothetical protein
MVTRLIFCNTGCSAERAVTLEYHAVSTWKHSLLASFHRETNGECQVRIHGTKITVSYEQHDGPVVYEGEEVAPGHFELACARKSGRATLHRFPGENLLEGYWVQGQDRGMWRIELKDERSSAR